MKQTLMKITQHTKVVSTFEYANADEYWEHRKYMKSQGYKLTERYLSINGAQYTKITTSTETYDVQKNFK